METNIILDLNESERALWAAELALARGVVATAFSFALICISDSLQHLAAFGDSLGVPAAHSALPEFLSACEGLVPQALITQTANAMAAGLINRTEAEAIACSLVLEERLRPQPWREQREPERSEVERAVEVARTLTNKIHALRLSRGQSSPHP